MNRGQIKNLYNAFNSSLKKLHVDIANIKNIVIVATYYLNAYYKALVQAQENFLVINNGMNCIKFLILQDRKFNFLN